MHAACGMFVDVSSRFPQKRQNCYYKTYRMEVPDTTWCSWLRLDILLVPFFKEEKWWHTKPFTVTLCGPSGAQPRGFRMPMVGHPALLEPT